jgi:glycosyltransferase involved in cell wall biosynthesis
MRILVLTNLYPNPFEPNRGLFNRNQIRHLAEEHEVTVISPILWTDEWAARRAGSSPLLNGRENELDGIPIVHPRYFYTPKVLRSCYGRFFKASVRRAFNRTVDRFQPDVVFSPWAYPDGWAAVELGHGCGLPVVIKVHGSDIHQLNRFPGRCSGTLQALHDANGVVVVSADLKDQIIRLGVNGESIRVIYNGIDAGVFAPGDKRQARARLGLPENRAAVVMVANFVPVKGHRILLEALKLLEGSGVPFDCHLLGDGPLRSSLASEAAALGLTHRVIFHGTKSQADLGDWYRAADIVAVPSLAEGIPNVLLEAMTCGVPCVATSLDGIREVMPMDYPCRLVPPGDAGALASAIQMMLHQEPQAARSQAAPRSHCQAAKELGQFLTDVRRIPIRLAAVG